MLTRPTHVYVGHPIDCKNCKGMGRVALGFMIGPDGPICPACNGSKMTMTAMTLEDFAALFTYGKVYPTDSTIGPDNAVMVRSERQGGGEGS